jgi:hypothetical protein
VLSARYGVEGGQLRDGDRNTSLWWRDIATLLREEWFSENVSRVVGDGRVIRFWTDVWVGGVSFTDMFYRLFELFLNKELCVFEMCQLGWGEDGEAWQWRRKLFAWEGEQVGELCLLLKNVNFQVDREDRWIWNLETSNAFSVRSPYKFLASQYNTDAMLTLKTL